MSLKDTWIDKKDTTTGLDGDDILAEDINAIANEVIKQGEKLEKISENEGAEQVQDDWNQNDDTQPDYIKNRTHYTRYNEETSSKMVTWQTSLLGETYVTKQWGLIFNNTYSVSVRLGTQTYQVELTAKRYYGMPEEVLVLVSDESYEDFHVQIEDDYLTNETRVHFPCSNNEIYPVQVRVEGTFTNPEVRALPRAYIKDLVKSNFNEDFLNKYLANKNDINDVYERINELEESIGGSLGDEVITPLISADWNQNDEAAPDYIKNRTHYDSKVLVAEFINAQPWENKTLPEPIDFENEYIININGTDVETVKEGTSADFFFKYDGQPVFQGWCNETENIIIVYPEYEGQNVSLYKLSVKQLDDKYIPDSIARVSDVQAMIGIVNDELESILAGGVD